MKGLSASPLNKEMHFEPTGDTIILQKLTELIIVPVGKRMRPHSALL